MHTTSACRQCAVSATQLCCAVGSQIKAQSAPHSIPRQLGRPHPASCLLCIHVQPMHPRGPPRPGQQKAGTDTANIAASSVSRKVGRMPPACCCNSDTRHTTPCLPLHKPAGCRQRGKARVNPMRGTRNSTSTHALQLQRAVGTDWGWHRHTVQSWVREGGTHRVKGVEGVQCGVITTRESPGLQFNNSQNAVVGGMTSSCAQECGTMLAGFSMQQGPGTSSPTMPKTHLTHIAG
jgi:hypothetical protein